MDLKTYEVPVDKLRWRCDPSLFQFECTKDLAPLREFIGQDRAARAVEFGLNMANAGYNIYVAGLTGTGKTSMVKTYIQKLIRGKESRGETIVLNDWCYIYNFKEPDRPQIVSLPQGKGKLFRDRMTALLSGLKDELGRAFSSDEYQTHRKQLVEEGRNEQQKAFEEIAEEARQQGFVLQPSPVGPVLIPIVDGRPMEEKEYLALDEITRKQLDEKRSQLSKKVQAAFEKAVAVQRQTTERLQKADKDIGELTVSRLFAPIVDEYSGWPKVAGFLSGLKTYTMDNLDFFKESEEPAHPLFGVQVSQALAGKDPFLPFQVNVFVDNSEAKGPPVVVEPNPNFGNMYGKIERRFLFGGYFSDHTMLKAGALNMADGGYLLLGARDIFMYVGVWEALKRVIKNKEVRIEDPFEQFGLTAPQGMRPEPMPDKRQDCTDR